jgi:hypothetical protein
MDQESRALSHVAIKVQVFGGGDPYSATTTTFTTATLTADAVLVISRTSGTFESCQSKPRPSQLFAAL